MVDVIPSASVGAHIREKVRRWQADCFEEFVKKAASLRR
jgi:hypothetical protein